MTDQPEKETATIGQRYHCRNCLTPFTARLNMPPGDQFCEDCNHAFAERTGIGYVRAANLEAMGFSPEEAERDIHEWRLVAMRNRLEMFDRQDLVGLRAYIDHLLAREKE